MVEPSYPHWQIRRTVGSGNGEDLGCGFLHKDNVSQASLEFCLDNYVGVLVIDGRGEHVDDKGRVFELEPGCFYQRFPNVPHETRVISETWLECFLIISGGLFHSLCALGFLDGHRPVLRPGIDLSYIESCSEIRERLKTASEPELPMILLEMQRSLMRVLQLDREGPGQAHQQICHACELLSTHLEQRCAVEDIAREVGMGYESFRKHFRRQIGISPGEYRIRRRLDAARIQLADPETNIAGVAEAMGYINPALFTRQFKRVTGMTPREFRSRQ